MPIKRKIGKEKEKKKENTEKMLIQKNGKSKKREKETKNTEGK